MSIYILICTITFFKLVLPHLELKVIFTYVLVVFCYFDIFQIFLQNQFLLLKKLCSGFIHLWESDIGRFIITV